MTRRLLQLAPLCLLAACADPLSGLEKLSDLELAQTDPVRGALASSEEITRDGPVLTDLLSSNAEVGIEQGVDTAPGPNGAPQKRGLFARLIPSKQSNEGANPVISDIDPLQISAESAASETENVVTQGDIADLETVAGDDASLSIASAAPVTQKKRAGFLGGLRKSTARPVDTVAKTPNALNDFETEQVTEQLTTDSTPDDAVPVKALVSPDSKPERRGFLSNVGFGPRADRPRKGPDAEDVVPGTALAYGTVARVCDVRGSELGKRIEKAGSGKSYALYDSAPGSTAPRTFYVTGFSDGCARQFTAALALFGAPSMHEQLRYGRPADQYPYSTTDKAYELVKSAICGVSKRKPCGRKISRLEKDTVFISTYERFTDNGRWADILLHDGRVLAKAIKDL